MPYMAPVSPREAKPFGRNGPLGDDARLGTEPDGAENAQRRCRVRPKGAAFLRPSISFIDYIASAFEARRSQDKALSSEKRENKSNPDDLRDARMWKAPDVRFESSNDCNTDLEAMPSTLIYGTSQNQTQAPFVDHQAY